MRNSKKLNLNELKVKSFVTDLEKDKENTVKGGYVQPDTNKNFPSCDGECIIWNSDLYGKNC